jgi:hypothetical protein
MPSFMTFVENTPIVFNAYIQKTSSKDFQQSFKKLHQVVKKNGMTWLILDLTGWEMTYQDLTTLVGCLAIRQAGSPYDHCIIPLVVCSRSVIGILKSFLQDHKAPYELMHCENLDEAYEVALAAWKLRGDD